MKQSTEDLLSKINKAKELVEVGGRYQHYKGSYYRVNDIAIVEADTSVCIIYEAEYAPGLAFVRPLEIWLETVMVDGQPVPRFKLV